MTEELRQSVLKVMKGNKLRSADVYKRFAMALDRFNYERYPMIVEKLEAGQKSTLPRENPWKADKRIKIEQAAVDNLIKLGPGLEAELHRVAEDNNSRSRLSITPYSIDIFKRALDRLE